MNTLELDKILSRNEITSRVYKGTYPANKLPIVYEYPSAFIANTHIEGLKGEHWVSFFFDPHSKGHFFDSFGHEPSYFHADNKFEMYIENNSNNCWIYNDKSIQSLFSLACGQFSIYFIVMKCLGLSMSQLLDPFGKDYAYNDRIVENFVEKYFGYSPAFKLW
jgi:hypothetical protein